MKPFGSDTNSLLRVALQYALAQSPNACVIHGFKNVGQVEKNAMTSGKLLSQEEIDLINREKL